MRVSCCCCELLYTTSDVTCETVVGADGLERQLLSLKGDSGTMLSFQAAAVTDFDANLLFVSRHYGDDRLNGVRSI
jgi:hypothetical protein